MFEETKKEPKDIRPLRGPIQRSPLPIAVQVITIIVSIEFVFAILIAINFSDVALSLGSSYTSLLLLAHIVKAGIMARMIVRITAEWANSAFFLERDHLVFRRGNIDTEESHYQLDKIVEVKLMQNTLGRLLNYGDVRLTFMFTNEPKIVVIEGILHPQRVEEYFAQHV